MFTAENLKDIAQTPPAALEPALTETEVQKAIRSLKNNKSAGIDNIRAEQLKYGGKTVPAQITNIINHIARTGEYPKEIKQGILTPLQKPGKKSGPPANLRPIILLSTIRKILAICLIRRIGEKIDANIPIEQAAYRAGRGTTEHAFAFKLLAEKAITSKDYKVHITLMDMSKAFDTVRRHQLMEDLRKILTPGELHMVKILVEDVELLVRIGRETSEPFNTKMGVPHGDCLSPILFTLYLAKALEEKNDQEEHENIREGKSTNLPPCLSDHTYAKDHTVGTLIEPKYADDISWGAVNCIQRIDQMKKLTTSRLTARGLIVNESKNEDFDVTANSGEAWKKCKILGSLLDTREDIKRRKQLANNAKSKLKDVFSDKKLSQHNKLRVFRACVESVFLYNSELWTMNTTTESLIDSYHRRLLRNIINIKWPNKITNEALYKTTKQKKWSKTIKTRRLSWFGRAAVYH